MKTTGRSSAHQNADDNKFNIFINEIKNDLNQINNCYTPSTAKSIKKEMIKTILEDL